MRSDFWHINLLSEFQKECTYRTANIPRFLRPTDVLDALLQSLHTAIQPMVPIKRNLEQEKNSKVVCVHKSAGFVMCLMRHLWEQMETYSDNKITTAHIFYSLGGTLLYFATTTSSHRCYKYCWMNTHTHKHTHLLFSHRISGMFTIIKKETKGDFDGKSWRRETAWKT